MDIVLVPGLWLDASSWDRVVPALAAAGHQAHPLTLPGMESREADRSGVRLQDHVDAVVAAIDAAAASGGQVLLVGHSLGSAVAGLALDARPDKVARVVYVGGWPTAEGRPLAGWAQAEGGEFDLPPFEEFDEADLRGFDEAGLTQFRAGSVPSPGALTTDLAHYTDDARYAVPVTAICPEYTAAQLQEWIAEGEANVAEFTRMRSVDYVDLPTGHWPQLTEPAALAAAINQAAAETA